MARGRRESGRAARLSRISPPSMNTTVSATSRAKPISWVTMISVVAGAGEFPDHVEHLVDEFGIERGGRLVEQQHLRLAGPARGRSRRAAAGRRRAGADRRPPCRRGPRGRAGRARVASASARAAPCTASGASTMFSSTVRCGNRLKLWNTMPTWTRRRRMSRSSSSYSRSPPAGSRSARHRSR